MSTDLQSALEHALALIPKPRKTPAAARGEPLFDHFADRLRGEVAALVDDELSYKTQGSTGAGNWSATPWVGVFDLSVTDSATRGHYLVYLFRSNGARVSLSLNQGTTAVYRAERRTYKIALEAKAHEYSALLGLARADGLQLGRLDLGGGRPPLTPGYEAGNVAAISYARGSVPENAQLAADLGRMLELYSLLTERIDRVAEGNEQPPSGRGEDGLEEERRLRWHKRFEGRNSRAAKLAKQQQGYACQGCERDYTAQYGKIGECCVDAHHLVPFRELGEGRRRLDPLKDFAILCAPCHRIVHSRPGKPLTIPQLRAIVAP